MMMMLLFVFVVCFWFCWGFFVLFCFLFFVLFHAEVSGGMDHWSVSSAYPLGWQLCTRVCTPKVEGLQSFPFVGFV